MGADPYRDDAERLRIARRADDASASRAREVASRGAPCVVGKVLTASGPSAPGFFKVQVHLVTGTETEGSAGVLTDAGYFLLAVNLGSAVPPATTQVICTFVDYRWVMRYDG